MKNKYLLILSILIISFYFLISLISAFGVTSLYWEGKPLVMSPGETKTVFLELQNMVGDEDVKLRAELVNGSEIASLIDENLEYLVPLGRKDIKVNIKIEIPENAFGSEYTVDLLFKQVSTDEGKMMQMTGGLGKSFKVAVKSEEEVKEEEKEKTIAKAKEIIGNLWVYLVLGILVIIVVIFFVVKKKKTKRKK